MMTCPENGFMKILLSILAIFCLSLASLAEAVEVKGASGPGPAIDAGGNPVVDPTRNVLELVTASEKRQDDLRQANESFMKSELARIDELRASESRRIDEEAKLRADFEDKLSIAEAKRIDAIRAVDVSAVQVASERATQQASVLANQVQASADALRALVATTATTMATQSQNATQQFTDRLASLEKSQYENKGRSGVADPQLADLITKVQTLATAAEQGAGKNEGINTLLSGSTSLIIALGSAIGVIFMFVTRRREKTTR
jgi:hypothetical protein